MPERKYELGVDLLPCDSWRDGFPFDDLIPAVRCNCREVSGSAVREELRQMLESREMDVWFLLEKNMDAIIAAAKEGR